MWRENDDQEKFYCYQQSSFDLQLIRIWIFLVKGGLFFNNTALL